MNAPIWGDWDGQCIFHIVLSKSSEWMPRFEGIETQSAFAPLFRLFLSEWMPRFEGIETWKVNRLYSLNHVRMNAPIWGDWDTFSNSDRRLKSICQNECPDLRGLRLCRSCNLLICFWSEWMPRFEGIETLMCLLRRFCALRSEWMPRFEGIETAVARYWSSEAPS